MSEPSTSTTRPPSLDEPSSRDDKLSERRRRLQRPMLLIAVLGLAFAGWYAWATQEKWWPLILPEVRTPGPLPRPPFQDFDLSTLTVPRESLHWGGPPKDGIPALTDPKWNGPERASRYLHPRDRVIGVLFEGEARAYPLKVLTWHEAVNDRIGRTPFLVTYCPLCDSAAVFHRAVRGSEREFGISGLLYGGNVILYDRNKSGSEGLWSQMGRQAISGPPAGEKLQALPFELTTWADWVERHPDTKVLSLATGHARNYMSAPYAGYFNSPMLPPGVTLTDTRLPPKARVLGVWTNGVAKAYPLEAFSKTDGKQTLTDRVGEAAVSLEYDPRGPSLRVVQADTGVQWMYAFWFAWSNFHPQTELYTVAADGDDANQ